MDVIQILKRLQELEKLKDILLTPQQKLILEYTPKPKLNPWISKGDPDYESMLSRSLATALPVKSQFLTKNEFLELYRAYLHITKDKDPIRSHYNELLKNKIGLETVLIFEELEREIRTDQNFAYYVESLNQPLITEMSSEQKSMVPRMYEQPGRYQPMYGTHEGALDQPLIMKKDEYSSNNRARYFPNHGTSINYFPNLPQSHSVITTFSGQTMPHNQHHINLQPTRYDRKGS